MGLFDDLLAAEAEISTPAAAAEIPDLASPAPPAEAEPASAPEPAEKPKRARKAPTAEKKPRKPRVKKLPDPVPKSEPEPEPQKVEQLAPEDADDFDRILDEGEPDEIESTRADEGLRDLQTGRRRSAARQAVEPDDLDYLEELRADPDRAAEADEFERALADEDADVRGFDELATRMQDDGGEDDEWMSGEDRSKLEAKCANLSRLNGVDLPRGWRKRSNADLRQLELELRGNQRSRLFTTGVRKAYFTTLSVLEAVGPKATFLGPEGLCVEGLGDALQGDEFVEEALQMISQDFEEQYAETMSPGVMLAVATAAAVTRLHASNLAARRALRTAPPSLVEKLSKLPPAPPVRGTPAPPAPSPSPTPTPAPTPSAPTPQAPLPAAAQAAPPGRDNNEDSAAHSRTLELLKQFAPKTQRM